MTKLIIVGAGGHGREMLWVAQRCGIDVLGFLVDGENHNGTTVDDISVLGDIDEWKKYADAEFIIAIGSPRNRKSVYDRMLKHGQPTFATLIDPTATVAESASVGTGSMVSPGAIISIAASVGRQVIVNINSSVSHDACVGDFVTVAPGVSICGSARVETGTELGAGCVVRDQVTLGPWSMAAMGAIVTADVPDNTLVAGCPARVQRTLS